MINEDYLACSAYEGQSAHETDNNFAAFYHEESKQHFFALLDEDGEVLLKSEGYPQPAARDNGIQSVIKNRTNRDFYSVKEDDGTYYLSLRAGNYREIARSCNLSTEAEAIALIAYATGAQVRGGVPAYLLAAADTDADAIQAAAAAKVEADIAAAQAAMTAEATTAEQPPVIVEVATVQVEAAAPTTVVEAIAPVQTVVAQTIVAETIATTEATAPVIVDIEDDYLPCRDYHGHTTSPRDGFRTFASDKTNKHYFAVVDADGDVTLRSEGHLTAEQRDADMAEVVQNMLKRSRYEIKRVGLRHHFIVLRNVDGKEIARSCAHENLESVHEAAPFLNPERAAPVLQIIETPVATATVAAVLTTAPVVKTVIEQPAASIIETLRVRQSVKDAPLATVQGTISSSVAGSTTVMPTIIENITTVVSAPSPPPPVVVVVPEPEPEPIVEVIPEPEPEPIVEVAPPAPVDVEDDYLPCREYEGRSVNDKANNVSMFKHDNGQFYFAILDEDGSVRLRSEGFRTSQDRDKELSGALKNLTDPDMYTTVRRGEYYMSILKDRTGREVGRSCLQKDEPKPIIAPVAIATVAAALPIIEVPEVEAPVPAMEVPVVKIPEPVVVAPAPPVYVAPEPVEEEIAETGFKWWWLLLPILALLCWWMFGRGCNKPVPTTAVVPTPTEVPATIEATPMPTAPSCDLNWILFEFDKANITTTAKGELAQMAKILKDNPDYVGVLSAHTDAKGTGEYNDALSLKRADAAKKTLVGMGINAGRLTTQADGKNSPIAHNTEDDAGRQFNRRVELYIKDKDGKDICQSIAPNVPDALKTK
ncbi:MAG: DUF1508 domain-containing protein [Saprospiraceae bacterium]|nr:DUF1508 domain-containing protein [Saprospiraceae bacterium]